MIRLSIKYWLSNKKRLASLVLSMIVGVVAIIVSSYLVRSMTLAGYKETFNYSGDYDYLLYNLTDEQYTEYVNSDLFSEVGTMMNLGEFESPNGIVFNAGSLDKNGESLYSIPVETGHYPLNENEITASRSVFESMGVNPKIGNTLTLMHRSIDGNVISKKQFVIAGILTSGFHVSSPIQKSREENMEPQAYGLVVPNVFMYYNRNNTYENVSILALSQSGNLTLDGEILYRDKALKIYRNDRLSLMSLYLPSAGQAINSYDDVTNLLSIANKNFDSSVLIPIFAVLISILSFISIFDSFLMSFDDRRRELSLLRCIGLSKKNAQKMLIAEAAVILITAEVIGIIMGIGAYSLILFIQAEIIGVTVTPAFSVPAIVASITLNPIIYSIVLCTVCATIAILIAIFKAINLSPLQDYQNASKVINRNRRISAHTISQAIDRAVFNKATTFITILVIMSSCLFGVLYFGERIKGDTSQLTYYLEEAQINGLDFITTKDFQHSVVGYAQLNRHKVTGVDPVSICKLEDNNQIAEVRYSIEDKSSKFIIPTDEFLLDKWGYLRKNELTYYRQDYATDIFDKTLLYNGYTQEETLINIPTVGVADNALESFSPYILSGEINPDNLLTGDEIIIVMQDGAAEIPFAVGDTVNFTDVVIDDERTENTDLSTGSVPDWMMPSFKHIIYDNNGDPFEYDGYAFGHRKDYNVKVGAIIHITDKQLSDFYYTQSLLGDNKFYFLSSASAFEKWGLPDWNITKLGIKLVEGANIDEVADLWYQVIGGSGDMSQTSVMTVQQVMKNIATPRYCLFITMISLLLLIGVISIFNTINASIMRQSKKIQMLRGIGMSKQQIGIVVCLQNLTYPIVCLLLYWIPVAVFIQVKNYVLTGIQNGTLTHTGIGKTPWYYNFPMYYDFTSEPMLLVALITFIITALIMILASINPLRTVFKKSIADGIHYNEF
jgi:putative ABC transport system permease protein